MRFSRARSAGLARFGLVGASGIIVNEAAIAFFVSGLGLHYVVGYLLATQCSTLWNFALIETWAFRTATPTNRSWHRFVMLMVVNNIANVLTVPLYILFTSVFGINYLVSNLLTLGIVFVGRFALAERIWGGAVAATGPVVTNEDLLDASALPLPESDAAPLVEHDELSLLRARVAELEAARARLERELADARHTNVDTSTLSDTVLPSHRERPDHQRFGKHRPRSTKWFPAGQRRSTADEG